MSIQAVAWAIETRVGNPMLKVLLIAIANYADVEWKCWPSQTTLAHDTEVADRTIRRGLKDLVELGFIAIEPNHRSDGSRSTSIIRIRNQPTGQNVHPPGHSSVHPAPDIAMSTPPDSKVSGATEPSMNHQIEPSNKNRGVGKPTGADIDRAFNEFWEAYPKRIGQRGKPEARAKFLSLVKTGAEPRKMIDEAERFGKDWVARVSRKPTDAQFIPMAATWLNKRRWDDEPTTTPVGGETMFDLANHFEQRVRDQGNEQRSDESVHYRR